MEDPTPEPTLCSNGHEQTPENLYQGKHCRKCKADRQRNYRDRMRGDAAFRAAENERQRRLRQRRREAAK